MELDFYDAMQHPDSLSLEEMIERDMRTRAFDECPTSESVLSNHAHAKDLDFDILTNPMIDDRLGLSDSDLLRDSRDLSWYNSPNGNLDSDPVGIFVNPRTGLPVTFPLDSSIDLDLLPAVKDYEDEEEQVAKSFNSVNPTMLEHHDANLLKEKQARINNGTKKEVVGGHNCQKNSANNVLVSGPLRREFDDTSSSSTSSSSESSSSEDENDECQNDEDDEDFDAKDSYFNPIASHTNKLIKRKGSAAHRPKNDERCLAPQSSNGERTLTGRSFPKPAYSYSCLIAMALKNSSTGSLPVSEIYGFMTENYPYFRTAPNGWKNSVRHNLSLNKCFEKIEKPGTGNQRKGCLWTMNPGKIGKMDEEVAKWQKKDPLAIKQSMAKPEHFELLEKGLLKLQVPSREDNNGADENHENNTTNPSAKIKTEPMQDSNDSHLDNSLLDLNYQSGLWGELDEKMDFDIPLATDSFPNVQGGFAFEDNSGGNSALRASGHGAETASVFNGTFLSKQLRVVKCTDLK